MPTLKSLIIAAKFDWVNSDITEQNFPIETTEPGKCELVDYKKPINTEDVLDDMEKHNLRPATLKELLTYAERKWNGKDAVIAFGSVWQGSGGVRFVPCLDCGGSGRRLGLDWIDGDWRDGCRFLAVRKSLDTGTLSPSESLEPSGDKIKITIECTMEQARKLLKK